MGADQQDYKTAVKWYTLSAEQGNATVISLFPANVSALGTLMIPIVGVISGYLMLDEPIGPRELSAVILICSALALTLFKPSSLSD